MQNQLNGFDDFDKFESNLSKQSQLSRFDILTNFHQSLYCMHFWKYLEKPVSNILMMFCNK